MTATGFAFLLPALFFERESLFAATVASWMSDLWTLFFIPLLLTYRTGGRLRTTVDRVLSARSSSRSSYSLRCGSSSPKIPPRSCSLPGLGDREGRRRVQRVLYIALSVGTAVVVAVRGASLDAGAPRDAAVRRRVRSACCCRRCCSPSTSSGGASVSSSCCGSRCARSRSCRSRSSRACCGPGWPAEVWPTCSASSPRCILPTCSRRWRGCCTTRSSRSPTPAGRRVRRRRRGGGRAAGSATGRSVSRVSREGVRSPRSCTTGRSTTTPSWSRPSAGRRQWRWRTGCCKPSPTRGSTSSRPHGRGSCPQPTPSGVASSATSTTAPSSGWSRWPCSCR